MSECQDSARRQLLRFALIGMASVVIPACRDSTSQRSGGPLAGDRFPDIDLPWLDAKQTPFSAPAGVPLLVNFWATWCEPCRREMPSLEKLSGLFPAGELMVIGISVDSEVNLAREFSLQNKLTFPLLSDSGMRLSNETLRIPAFPMTYLLKRDHTIARIFVGARDWTEPTVIDAIKHLLRE